MTVENTKKISEGLHLIYTGNMIAIVSLLGILLAFLMPLLALVIAFVALLGGIVSLVGLAKLRKEHTDYMSALVACVLGIVFGLLANNESTFGSLMDLANSICSLLQAYFIIRGTNSFLRDRGYLTEVSMGDKAWRWQLISAVASVAVTVLAAVTFFVTPALSVVLMLGVLIVSIIALVFYLSYLKASAGALG